MRLEEIWQKVNALLSSAFILLPHPIVKNNDYLNAEQDFKLFLEKNELELALDAIESLGDSNIVPDLFWEKLIDAATLMDLNERKNEMKKKVSIQKSVFIKESQ